MKVIGITRRMDDLGRVVIPKEVRQSLGINEGDFLEIVGTDRGLLDADMWWEVCSDNVEGNF